MIPNGILMARIPGFHCHGPSSITGQGTEILQTSSVTRISKFFFFKLLYISFGYPGGCNGKELTCQCKKCKRCKFDLWVMKIPWRRKWQPTPVFLPGESHGQRSLMGNSPWGCKELDTTERQSINTR